MNSAILSTGKCYHTWTVRHTTTIKEPFILNRKCLHCQSFPDLFVLLIFCKLFICWLRFESFLVDKSNNLLFTIYQYVMVFVFQGSLVVRGRDCMEVGFTTPYAIRCTRYNFRWWRLLVICDWWVVFSRFLTLTNLTPQYNWNIVESGVKHHALTPLFFRSLLFTRYSNK